MTALLAALHPLPSVHPMVVHFSVVLLLVAVALDAFRLATAREALAVAARWALVAGTVAAALAVWTGHESAEAFEGQLGPGARTLVALHHDGAMIVLGVGAVLSVCRLVAGERRWRYASLALGAILAALVAAVAHLGGQLVFLHGVAVRPPS